VSEVLLKVDGLSTCLRRGAGDIPLVDGVSFEIRRGETFALVGESGCGKSMTSLSLMRLVPAAARIVAGRATMDGEDLLGLSESAMRRVRGGRVAMIFQEPMTSLNPVMTAGEQVAEAVRWHRRVSKPESRRIAIELLDAVGIADARRRYSEYPHRLSGGMKQRVMIAIALAGEPSLLIADEPSTALDVTIQAQVLSLLKRLQRERGMSVMLITHDLGVVAEMADRIAVMYAGRIVEQSSRERFFAGPLHPYSRRLLESLPGEGRRRQRLTTIPGSAPRPGTIAGCRFAPRCAHAWSACTSEPELIPVDAGGQVRCHLHAAQHYERLRGAVDACVERQRPEASIPKPVPPAGEPLLELRNLAVEFAVRSGPLRRLTGRVRAVDGVSLTLRAGSTLALVGESGCGKTTVGKAIVQLVRPDAGRILFAGEDLARLDGEALRRRRRDLQFVFQDGYASMNPRMRVADIVAEGMITLGLEPQASRRADRVAELLEAVGLPAEAARRYPHEFSGGQRQRICIARALAVDPRLIVCDEPTSALDLPVQAQILNLLQDLQDARGLSYLFVTHNLPIVASLADEVAVMYLGRIVEYGPALEVLRDPRHPYTRALIAAVPRLDRRAGIEPQDVSGELPSPMNPPAGCHFHTRCPHAAELCRMQVPDELSTGAERWARCHFA
jgi:oligopeptide/dipeptide ABC transporter ATP-binding protein